MSPDRRGSTKNARAACVTAKLKKKKCAPLGAFSEPWPGPWVPAKTAVALLLWRTPSAVRAR
eukprot:3657292-Prymnesium_polylepis.1